MIYKITNNKYIKIFGRDFVQNNKDKCKILINGKEQQLKYYVKKNKITKKYKKCNNTIKQKFEDKENILNSSNKWQNGADSRKTILKLCANDNEINEDKGDNNDNEFFIKLIAIDKITDMSYMFFECKSLISLSDICKFDTSRVTDMSNMFNECESLKILPDISQWDTSRVTDMSLMFFGCRSLLSLPDISKWNTSNVEDMSLMFYGCESLISFPDISKWDVLKVRNMFGMFSECKSLLLLPTISLWKQLEHNYLNEIYAGCINCINIHYIFSNYYKVLNI